MKKLITNTIIVPVRRFVGTVREYRNYRKSPIKVKGGKSFSNLLKKNFSNEE